MSPLEAAPAEQPGSASCPIGAALALATASSVPAALPALLRVMSTTPSVVGALGLVGSVSLLVVPTSLWLRRAREGSLPAVDRALAWGVALSALPLALFGGVLKSTTHHRPLGGATFAVVALGLLTLCIGLALRVFVASGRGTVKPAWRNLFILGCGLSLAGALLLGMSRAARPSLVDFLGIAVGVAMGGLVPAPAGLLGLKLPAALVSWAVLLVGAAALLREPELVRSLTTQAPVSFAALSWLGGGF